MAKAAKCAVATGSGMELFSLEKFTEDPRAGLRRAERLRKADWLQIAEHYGVSTSSSSRKEEIRVAVMQALRELGHVEEEQSQGGDRQGSQELDDVAGGAEWQAFELRKLEMQYQREREKEEREREENERKRQHELEMARLSRGSSEREGSGAENGFAYKARNLMPKFSEEEPDDFFSGFEDVANAMGWPREKWALLVRPALTGKAMSVSVALDALSRQNYDRLKEEVLKAYEITPEFYRVKFRGARKSLSQKYTEFGHVISKSLDKWWKALEVSSLEAAREAILLEQFMSGVEPRVRMYLCERRVKAVEEAVRLAEDYDIVNRPSYARNGVRSEVSGRPSVGQGVARARCFVCGKDDHLAANCPKGFARRGAVGQVRSRQKCYACGKEGHMAPECPTRKAGSQSGNQWRGKASAMCTVVRPARSPVGGSNSVSENEEESFKDFSADGYIADVQGAGKTAVRVLRDTAATRTMVREEAVAKLPGGYEGNSILVRGLGGTAAGKLTRVKLELEGVSRDVEVCLTRDLPVRGYDILLGNDLGGGRIEGMWKAQGEERSKEEVVESQRVAEGEDGEERSVGIGEACAVAMTRSRVREEELRRREEEEEALRGMSALFSQAGDVSQQRVEGGSDGKQSGGRDELAHGRTSERGRESQETRSAESGVERPALLTDGAKGEMLAGLPCTKEEIVEEQRQDPGLQRVLAEALTEEEARQEACCFYLQNGLLKRRKVEAPADGRDELHQVVIPRRYREEVIRMAHEDVTAHQGITKTGDAIRTYFYWPGMNKQIKDYCKRCRVCQIAQDSAPKPVPLFPIPVVDEPFSELVVDVVGPLPRTKNGNQYLLTVMCRTTRYPEAIPMSSCMSRKLMPRLLDVFSKFGVPRVIQSDQGSNFMGKLFRQAMEKLGVKHVYSSPYHPQSQGCLERFHRSLKSVLTKFCMINEQDWDEGVQVALYALRAAKQESLGYSPFELMFGRRPREGLRLIYEACVGKEEPEQLATYISKLKGRMECARRLARENLEGVQEKMKVRYDRKTKMRSFKPGDFVLMFRAGGGRPLQARYQGPYEVIRKSGPVNYTLCTPGRRKKTTTVHVNLLKKYEGEVAEVAVAAAEDEEVPEDHVSQGGEDFRLERAEARLSNAEGLERLALKLTHLSREQGEEIKGIVEKFPEAFADVPTQTTLLCHDVTLRAGATPIRQHPYRLSPEKRRRMREEVEYLLQNGLAVPSQSPWASPCLLVPKEEGKFRLCTDYRKLNTETVADSYPMPRIEDLIDEVSGATYLTKIDLLKGFYQVPLTQRAREASAFVTPDGLYEYTVMPFGMRNSGSTFQRLANWLVSDLPEARAYVDDIVIASKTWQQHLKSLEALLKKLTQANLTVNLQKCEFAAATLTYLGHRVGRGAVQPLEARVRDVVDFPAPKSRRSLRRFLGMASFYRRFCRNFAQVASPLTDMLSERRKFVWSVDCQKSFEDLKALLTSAPVLRAPDFDCDFVLCVDASDVGVGGVLCQSESDQLMPVAYMSQKLDKYQRKYSVIEKEALAIIKCIEKFEPYLDKKTVIYSDHNPLKFVNTLKTKNARLARWALILQGKDIEIRHISGKENIVADALSRPDIEKG